MDLLVDLESSPKVIHCRSKSYSFNMLNNSVLTISTLPKILTILNIMNIGWSRLSP